MSTRAPAETRAESQVSPSDGRKPWLRRLGVVSILLLLACAWPAYRYWLIQRSAWYKAACKAAVEARDGQRLEDLARRWLRFDGGNADAWLYSAEAAQQQGDLARTAECLGQLPDSDLRTLAALAEKSMLEFGTLNQPLAGVATCERLLELEPMATVARKRLIFYYAMTLQAEPMLAQIRAAIEHGCERRDAYVYLMLADGLEFTNGLDWTTRWLTSAPGFEEFLVAQAVHVAKLAYGKAMAYPNAEHEREHTEALKRVRELRDRFPANPVLLSYLMERGVEAGDFEQVGDLLHGVEVEGNDEFDFWRFRGWYHAAVDQLEQADRAYQRSLKLHPLSWQTRHLYAALLRRLKRLGESEQMQRLALDGKELRKELMQLKNTESVTDEVLLRIGSYASACGDERVAQALSRRLGVDFGRRADGHSAP